MALSKVAFSDDRGYLCLPESNKVSASAKMQYFNLLSIMLFQKIVT
jgi:hypothetical protein